MRLSEFHPTMDENGYLSFDCPIGHPHRITIPTDKSKHDGAWSRSGEFPDTLTLSPSILAHTAEPNDWDLRGDDWKKASTCGWHGFIRNGEIIHA